MHIQRCFKGGQTSGYVVINSVAIFADVFARVIR